MLLPQGLRLPRGSFAFLMHLSLMPKLWNLSIIVYWMTTWMNEGFYLGKGFRAIGNSMWSKFRNLCVLIACWRFQKCWPDFLTLHSLSCFWTSSVKQPLIYWILSEVYSLLSNSAPRFHSSFFDIKLRPRSLFLKFII